MSEFAYIIMLGVYYVAAVAWVIQRERLDRDR